MVEASDHHMASGIPRVRILYPALISLAHDDQFTSFKSSNAAWLLSMLVAGSSTVLALVTIIYLHVLDDKTGAPSDKDTILTWTCKFRNVEPSSGVSGLPKDMTNDMFGKLCDESVGEHAVQMPALTDPECRNLRTIR